VAAIDLGAAVPQTSRTGADPTCLQGQSALPGAAGRVRCLPQSSR
jgi:hypothetical protein